MQSLLITALNKICSVPFIKKQLLAVPPQCITVFLLGPIKVVFNKTTLKIFSFVFLFLSKLKVIQRENIFFYISFRYLVLNILIK